MAHSDDHRCPLCGGAYGPDARRTLDRVRYALRDKRTMEQVLRDAEELERVLDAAHRQSQEDQD